MKTIYSIAALAFLFTAMPALSAVKVISVKGEAGLLDKGRVQRLTAGMALQSGQSVVTGVNSQAVLDIDGSRLTVRSLTTMKIASNTATKNSSDTRVALKRGSVVSEVSKIKDVKTSFRVSTPVATSSVRGTKHIVTHGPENGTLIEVLEGVVEGETADGGTKTITNIYVFKIEAGEALKSLAADLRDAALTDTSDRYLTAAEFALNENYSGEFMADIEAAVNAGSLQKRTLVIIEVPVR